MYNNDISNTWGESNPCCCDVPSNYCEPKICPPVMECPEERCEHREIMCEVPHIVPINTKIINHHIYKHVYVPKYTCCEEHEVTNIYEKRCRF